MNVSTTCGPCQPNRGWIVRVCGAPGLALVSTFALVLSAQPAVAGHGSFALTATHTAPAAVAGRGQAASFALAQAASPAPAQDAPAAQQPPSRALSWTPFSAEAFTAAQRSKAPFVLSFSAQWCEPCDKLKARTYADARVIDAASGMRLLLVDMTHRDRYLRLVLKSFDVFGAPTTIFFGPDGRERERRIGFISPDDYARLLRDSWKPKEPGNNTSS